MTLLKTRPRQYQARAANLILEKKFVALFMEQRTGKTLACLLALARLWKQGLRRVLVVGPKSSFGVWKRQARLHLNIPYIVFDGSTEGFFHPEGVMARVGGLQIAFVNYERTWRLPQGCLDDAEAVIVDESHRIKHGSSRQSKACWLLGVPASYRVILTGTPTDGDEIDLWSQFRFLDSELLGDDWREFERKWCRKAGYGNFARKIKKHKKKDYMRIVRPYCFHMTRDEALHLPKEQDYVIEFPLTGKVAKAYEDLETKLRTEVRGEAVVTPRRVTQMIKLQQLTGGFLHTTESTVRMSQDKLNTMHDWLQDYSPKTKIIVFARFVEEINAINWLFSKSRSVGILWGKSKDRGIWERFQDEVEPRMLVIQSQTGGESIEVSVADIGIFYSRTFSWINYDQCRARLLGRRKNVLFGHLLAENSIDIDIYEGVRHKGNGASSILSQLNRRLS